MDSLSPHDYRHQPLPFDGTPLKSLPNQVRLQDAKSQLGISSKMLAKRAGVSASTITNCEQGRGVLVPKATQIIDALNAFRREHGLSPLALQDIDWNVKESVHTPEGRARMSEKRRGEGNPMYGKPSAMRGRKGTTESNKKKSEANKNKIVSEETRKKQSAVKIGKKQSEEARKKSATAGLGKKRSLKAKKKYSEAKTAYWAELSKEERAEQLVNWTKAGQAASPIMTKDTKPELAFEARLKEKGWQLGIDYVKQFEIGACHVDFYLIHDNLVIEVFGCWSHQCVQCGYTQGTKWGEDIFRTATEVHRNDMRRIKYIESKGYSVQVVWAHELNGIAD